MLIIRRTISGVGAGVVVQMFIYLSIDILQRISTQYKYLLLKLENLFNLFANMILVLSYDYYII